MKHLILYSRVGCHLCDDLQEDLQFYQQRYEFQLDIYYIDRDPELKQRFNTAVPVLQTIEGMELCRYTLDSVSLLDYLGVQK